MVSEMEGMWKESVCQKVILAIFSEATENLAMKRGAHDSSFL